jgi:hypothetical protein
MPVASSQIGEASLCINEPTSPETVFVLHHKNGNQMQIVRQGIFLFLQQGYHTTFVVLLFRTSTRGYNLKIDPKGASRGSVNCKTMFEIHYFLFFENSEILRFHYLVTLFVFF